jgi:hypothetical protein
VSKHFPPAPTIAAGVGKTTMILLVFPFLASFVLDQVESRDAALTQQRDLLVSIGKLLAGLSVAVLTSSAHATVIYSIENAGVRTTQVAGATTIDFNNGTCGAYIHCSDASIVSGSVAGRYASPYGITDRYLTVGHGSTSVSLGGSYDYFGLYWGSIDTYNFLSFYLGDQLVDTFSGSDLPPLVADGNQAAWSSNRYLNFFFSDGDLFDRVVLRSDGYAFESDNHAFAAVSVPEPGTLALLAAGLLGIAASRRRAAQR